MVKLEGITTREFMGIVLGLTASAALPDVISAQSGRKKPPSLDELPVLKKRRITWDFIKKAYDQYQGMNERQKAASTRNYHKLISRYLDQVLVDEFQIVHDKRRNPYGFMSNWYLIDDPKQRKQVEERVKKEWTAGPKAAAERIKLFDAANLYWISPKMNGFDVPSGQRRGFMIVNDSILGLKSEDELFSLINYARNNAFGHEFDLKSGKKKWENRDMNAKIYRGQVVCLQSRAIQLGNILSGKRKVSDSFSKMVMRSYLSLYANCRRFAADLDKDSKEPNNLYAKFDKHNAEVIRSIMSDAETAFGKHGYEHKKVGSKYSLVKK